MGQYSLPDRALPRAVITGVVLLAVSCDSGGNPVAPGGPGASELDQTLETATTSFRFSAGDAVDSERQEAYNEWIQAELGLALPGKLRYFKYRDRAQMRRVTGRDANGFAEPQTLTVHSIFPWHNHETAHVYTEQVGRPTDFFNEGIAVALSVNPLSGDFSPTYSGTESVHDWSRRSAAQLRPIPEIVTTADFRAVEEFIGYQEAGSFVQFLRDERGTGSLMDFFAMGTRDDALGRIRESFAASFGVSLEQAEAEWRRFLGL